MAGPRPPQQWRGLLAIVVWCVAAFLYTHPQRHVDEVKNHWQSLQRPAAPQWYEPAWSAATPAPTAAPRAGALSSLYALLHDGHGAEPAPPPPRPAAAAAAERELPEPPPAAPPAHVTGLSSLYALLHDGHEAPAAEPETAPEPEAAPEPKPGLASSLYALLHDRDEPPAAPKPEAKPATRTCLTVDVDDGFGRVPVGASVVGEDGVAATPCEAKSRCRRSRDCAGFARDASGLTRFLTASELAAAAAAPEGSATLSVALYGARGDALRSALAAWDARPALQTLSSNALEAARAGWGDRGGAPFFSRNATVPHYSRDGALPVAYDVSPLHAELWADANKKLATVDEGLCEGKTRCANRKDCGGFIYRVRDGAAVLYGGPLKTGKAGAPAVEQRLRKRARKVEPALRLYRKAERSGRTRVDVCVSADGVAAPRLHDDAGARDASGVAGALAPYAARARAGAAPRVIVSLTTLPGRIEQIRPVLESLLDQTAPAFEIQVHAPLASTREKREYASPDWLRRMATVRLVRSARDYGPATKVIPAIMNAQARAAEGNATLELDGTLYVVVDDDTLYPPRLLETLASWSARFPDATLSSTGWPVTRSGTYPHWTENYLVYGNELYAPHAVSIIRGNCGFAVKAKFFDDALWRTMDAAPPGATIMDDVWISGHLARRGVPRFVVPSDGDQFTRTPHFENVVTLDGNLGKGVTDRKQANEAGLRHFKDDWDVFWDPPRPAPRPRA